MAPSRMAEQVGRVLGGRYRLVAPIGLGASAQVFLADDVSLRRRVAVKLLHPALAQDDGFLRRFRAEAQAAAALSHPNVMAVYDWGEDDGPYLLLEYLGGGSLRAMLDRGARLTPAQALAVGLDTARALDYAHRRGFVHRDIKPANLLFDDEGRLRIADFGLARALAEAAWTEPQGAVVGTARYASPEQARGEPVTGKADVYALALVLVEAVTGKVPFAADTTIGTLMARIDRRLEVPAELGPLVAVLEQAGDPDPAKRPDAEEFGRSLMAAARELDPPAPLPLVGAVDEPDATAVVDGDPTLLPEPPPTIVTGGGVAADGENRPAAVATVPGPRRRRWPWILLAVILVGALGTGGAFAWRELRAPSAPVPGLEGLSEDAARDVLRAVQAQEDVEWEVQRETDHVDDIPAGIVFRQNPDEGEELGDGGTLTYTMSLGPPPRRVPELEGLSEAEARTELEEAEIEVGGVNATYHEQIERGGVVSWWQDDVERPVEVAKGSAVVLIVSQGPEPRSIPDLSGRTFDEAKAALEERGLKAEKVEEFSRTVDKDRVIRTEPPAGRSVDRGGTVNVIVSKGRDLVSVPNMDGMTITQATAALEKAGLERGDVFGRGDTVFAADPEFDTKVDRGSVVDLFVRR